MAQPSLLALVSVAWKKQKDLEWEELHDQKLIETLIKTLVEWSRVLLERERGSLLDFIDKLIHG